MTPETVQEAAELLLKARGDHRKLDGFPETCRPGTAEEGYQIQSALARLWGLDVAGWKIGCTTKEAMAFLKADGPFAGRIFAPYVLESPATVSHSAFHMVGAETEFAFRLGRDLAPGEAPFTRDRVADAVESLHPAIEIVNNYWSDWLAAGVPSIVADNGSNGGLVLGPAVPDWRSVDLTAAEASITIDGVEKGRGTGAMVLGHPLDALVWLANYLAGHGETLAAGQYVSTGTLTGMNPVRVGETAVSDFGPLGTVELRVTA